MSHDGGVQVQVGVGPQGKASEKQQAAAAATPAAAAAAAAPETAPEGRSSTCMWALFVCGWMFPPCWWAGTAAGFRTGGAHECLVKRRTGMSKSALMAWAASIATTFISAVVLILVLATYFGRPAPQQDGPYYITLAGPGDVFPDLSDAQQLSFMSQALYAGLALPGAYPLSGISLWVDSTTTLPNSGPAARRMLLQDTLPANETTEVAVLAYTLKNTPDLPDSTTLTARIEDGSAADCVSEALLTTGLVAAEHVGKLSLGLIGSVSREKLAAILERREGNPALNLVPVGKRCKGAWSEWTECVPCANRTRTFTIPTPTTEAEPASAEQPPSRRLLKADDRRPGNSNGNGAQPGGNGRNGAPTGGQGSGSAPSYGAGSQVPGFDRRPPQATQSSQGLAHAFGQGHGLALALGQIDCAVVNNTVAVEACECPDGYCSGTPVETAGDGSMFEWDCVTGTANSTLCAGTCSNTVHDINGTAEALCVDSVYTVTNNTCAIAG